MEMHTTKIRKRLMPVILIALLFCRAQAFGQGPEVSITPNADYQQTRYTLTAGDGRDISLITYQTEINRSVLRLRSESDAPLDDQIRMLSHLFQAVLRNEKHGKFETLFVGGLMGAFGVHNNQMSVKLALAAHASALWDNRKGRPVSGHENDLLIKLSNQYHIYPELSSMFAEHGYAVRISGIEKVFIKRVDDLPIADALKARGVKPSDRLPYDGLTWFALSAPGTRAAPGGGNMQD